MMINVEEFMEKNPKRQKISKLESYKKDIFMLKNAKYSYQQILNFLKQNGVEIGLTTLKSFIKRRESEMMDLANSEPKKDEMTKQAKTSEPSQKEPQKDEIKSATKLAREKSGIKKFNWKDATSEGLI